MPDQAERLRALGNAGRSDGGSEAPHWGSIMGLRSLVTQMPSAVVCLDEAFKISLFNERAEALFGYRSDDVLHKSFSVLLAPVPPKGRQEVLDELLGSERGQSAETTKAFTAVHRNGEEFQAEMQIRRIAEPDWQAVVLVLRDIRHRQIAEEALITAKNEAEIANRAKSEFLANMSHELRNPLNAIIGFSEIIQNEALGPVGQPDYRDYAENIQISGRHLLKLINDILDLSKIEVGKLALNEDRFKVGDIIHACIALMGGQAREAGVDLQQETAQSLPTIYADERMLRQILINLLSNAIKFTPEGGSVRVQAWDHADDGLVLQVADTGIGMTLEDIPRAMIRFAQTPSPVTRKFEGNGLGLPLTKSLIELHGGSLDLQSKVDVGTTVTVRLPAERIVREG
ncbi:MAG: PAS domain-containing sensor histidine kinase [Kiloniellales bacterium]|nr:PAS domain-containing sensor histidine kinase [Kiloniellales bacterium]